MRFRWPLPVFIAATALALSCVLPRYEADRSDPVVVQQDGGSPESSADAAPEALSDIVVESSDEPSASCDECQDPSLLRAPCRPVIADPAGSTEPLVFAARSIRYGVSLEKDAGDAWRTIGIDLDCLATNATGQPTQCKLGDGMVLALKASAEDGDQGRDNSFGHNFGALFRLAHDFGASTQPDEEALTNERWEQGLAGLLVKISGFSGADDDPKVQVAVLSTGGTLASDGGHLQPAWNGDDEWTVSSASLSAGEPRYIDDNAYVTGGLVVASLPSLPLQFGPGSLALSIDNSKLIMRLSADRTRIEEATMGGTWLTSAARDMMDTLLQQGCVNDGLRETALNFLVASSDVRHDLKPAPDVACDAISFSFVFTAHQAKLGHVITPGVAPPLDGGCEAGNPNEAGPD